jgi:hypothetical protein
VVLLPVDATPGDNPVTASAAPAVTIPSPDLPRVLLVEDEGAVRELLSSALERNGFDVVTAGSAEEALTLASPAFQILLSDISLPGMSGVQLARQLRRSLPSLRVLLMSGCAREVLLGPMRWTTCRSFPSRSPPAVVERLRSLISPPGRSRPSGVSSLGPRDAPRRRPVRVCRSAAGPELPEFGHPACAWIALVPLFLAERLDRVAGPLPGTPPLRGPPRPRHLGRLLLRHALLDRPVLDLRRPAGAARRRLGAAPPIYLRAVPLGQQRSASSCAATAPGAVAGARGVGERRALRGRCCPAAWVVLATARSTCSRWRSWPAWAYAACRCSSPSSTALASALLARRAVRRTGRHRRGARGGRPVGHVAHRRRRAHARGLAGRVGLIQGNVEQKEKWDPRQARRIFTTYIAMTRDAVRRDAQ